MIIHCNFLLPINEGSAVLRNGGQQTIFFGNQQNAMGYPIKPMAFCNLIKININVVFKTVQLFLHPHLKDTVIICCFHTVFRYYTW